MGSHLLCKHFWKHLASFPGDPHRTRRPCFFSYFKTLTHLLSYFWKTSVCLPSGLVVPIYKSYRTPLSYETWQASWVSKKTPISCFIAAKEKGPLNTGAWPGRPPEWLPLNLFLACLSYLSELLNRTFFFFLNRMTKCSRDFCWKKINFKINRLF